MQGKGQTGDSEFYGLTSQLFRGECGAGDIWSAIHQRVHKHFHTQAVLAMAQNLFHNGDGFYSWSGLHHFVFEYEFEAKGQNEPAKINWDAFTRSPKGSEITIEHIYPQSPNADEWPEFEEYDEQQRRCLTHSLGNLLALSRNKNIALSNKPFAKKVKDTVEIDRQKIETGYFNGSYSENEVATYCDWTPDHVLYRGLRLLEFLEERWKVQIGSPDRRRNCYTWSLCPTCHPVGRRHEGPDNRCPAIADRRGGKNEGAI